jgi:hypothetical protein
MSMLTRCTLSPQPCPSSHPFSPLSPPVLSAVFNPFLLLYAGIVLVIASVAGLRVSTSESPVLMATYLAFLLPLIVTLLSTSSNIV